ncbi:FKBP-type peptidyl-prolyl cis-trans isomerase [Petrachloros mirabilis]
MRNYQHEQRRDILDRSATSPKASDARRVKLGDTVRVDFLAWTEDGKMVECSLYNEPLTFTAGGKTVMEGMEELVIGMRVGESRTEMISSERAFGPYREDLCCQVSASWLKAQSISPLVGLRVEVRQADEISIRMTITEVNGDRVTLDANHQFAGKSLILQLDLVEIVGHVEPDAPAKPALEV